MTQPTTAPARTADPRSALDLVRTDGAAILTGAGATGEHAVAAARAIFGDKVRAVPEAAEVRSGGVRDLATRRPSPDEALGAHTDGFAYGDDYPDFFLLLCARDSPIGGDSFLVDGYGLLDAVSATDDDGARLVERLHSVPVDQTESGMHRSVSPLVGRAPGGRRMVRRFPFQRPSDESTDPASDAGLVAAWDQLCREGADRAARFHLAPGEVAVIDNYRMLHGREPYVDPERLMWRVWVWTDEAKGVPAGTLASDSRHAKVEPTSTDWPTISGDTTSVIPVSAQSPTAASR